MVLWGSMPVSRGTDSSLAQWSSRGPPQRHTDGWPQMVVHVGSSHGCETRTRVGEVLITGHPPCHHLKFSGPAHLARSAKKCGWGPGSGRDLGRGWCSSACGERPGTSLLRRGSPMIPRQMPTTRNRHPHSQGPILEPTLAPPTTGGVTAGAYGDQAPPKSTLSSPSPTPQLTLVSVEIAGNVDALTAHHHHLPA